jgi:hypothetical protein
VPEEPPRDQSQAVAKRSRVAALIVLLSSLLAVGVASFGFVRAQQDDAGTLVALQQYAQTLTPAAVARVVRAAPESVSGEKAVRASCVSLGKGELLNPWTCSLSYAAGLRVQYTVTIRENGSYVGNHQLILQPGPRRPDTGRITGCCISIP